MLPTIISDKGEYFLRISEWINSNKQRLYDHPSTEDHDILSLLLPWSTGRKGLSQNSNEATQRCVAEQLLNLAFHSNPGDEVNWRVAWVTHLYIQTCMYAHVRAYSYEVELAVPLSQIPRDCPYWSASVIADAYISVHFSLPKTGLTNPFTTGGRHAYLSGQYRPKRISEQSNLLLGVFVAEWKVKKEAVVLRQMAMDLFNVQNQRRALGLQQRLVYGGVYVNGQFQIYVSEWKDEGATVVSV